MTPDLRRPVPRRIGARPEPLSCCPFCASADVGADHHPEEPDWHVVCARCGAKGPDAPTLPHALQAWNRRNRVDRRQ